MKANDLRDQLTTDAELARALDDKRQELFNLRFQHATGQLDNTARIGQVRKDVARIETILRQRATEQQPHEKKKSKATRKSQHEQQQQQQTAAKAAQ